MFYQREISEIFVFLIVLRNKIMVIHCPLWEAGQLVPQSIVQYWSDQALDNNISKLPFPSHNHKVTAAIFVKFLSHKILACFLTMAPKGRQKERECQITCHIGFSVYSLTVWEDSESEKRKKRKKIAQTLVTRSSLYGLRNCKGGGKFCDIPLGWNLLSWAPPGRPCSLGPHCPGTVGRGILLRAESQALQWLGSGLENKF